MRCQRSILWSLVTGVMVFANVCNSATCDAGSSVPGACTVAAPDPAAATDPAYLWISNDADYGTGTVSKVATQPFASGAKYRETARYASVTCQSDPVNGSKEGAVFSATPPATLCTDGIHGCCSRDESVPGANGLHEPVNLIQNRPVRTAVDVNGNAWVVNAANGDIWRQSSVTLIAASLDQCVERNGVPGIQTSSDVDADGIIETDCNNNGVADDLADVNPSSPCLPGHPQEFFGLDDECVLFTVNVGAVGDIARALALGKGATTAAPADAWVGTYANGRFYRIDGSTGTIQSSVALISRAGMIAHPYGAVIDAYGILWTENVNSDGNCTHGCLFYFDTANTSSQDAVTPPLSLAGNGFNGIALDGYSAGGLVQQVWLGTYSNYGAYRYRPSRGGSFAQLRNGSWALGTVSGVSALGAPRGVSVDDRTPAFAWVAFDSGSVARIPADMPDGNNSYPAASHLFATNQNATVGTGVAGNRDVWAVNRGSSTLTHFSVDAAGNVTNAANPDQLNLDDRYGAPEAFSCPHPMFGLCKPHPDTNSDFTGFAYLNFTLEPADRVFANGFE